MNKCSRVRTTIATYASGAAANTGAAPPSAAVPVAGRPKAAPAVRKLALDRGVDLAAVSGTGPGGRILAADVEAAAHPPAPAAAS